LSLLEQWHTRGQSAKSDPLQTGYGSKRISVRVVMVAIGRVKKNRAPLCAELLSAAMRPPCTSITERQMHSPIPIDRPKLLAGWQKMMATEEPTEGTARLRRFDGSHRRFLFRPSALRDEAGKLVRWYGRTIDVEDRKRAESALLTQARSTNGNISFRTVAHDQTTLRCSVEDSGPRIEAEHVMRLFDSFFTTRDAGRVNPV
jgi:hypothetical protein